MPKKPLAICIPGLVNRFIAIRRNVKRLMKTRSKKEWLPILKRIDKILDEILIPEHL